MHNTGGAQVWGCQGWGCRGWGCQGWGCQGWGCWGWGCQGWGCQGWGCWGSFWDRKCWFFIAFIRENGFRDKKYQYFIGFYRFFEKNVAVLREPWCEVPPFPRHSITFFGKVHRTHTTATFFFWKNTILLIKQMKYQHFGSQNDPTTKYTTLGRKFYGHNFLQ